MRSQSTLALLTALSLAACDRADRNAAVTMSLIGGPLHLTDPNRAAPDKASALMLGATAQGLISFDAEGQIEPALAERWIMTDDGLSLIFRIRRAQWAGGGEVTARQVVARLKAALAPASRNRLKPLFGGVENIVAMTGQVVEIRLRRPDPDMLQLLAQPDMALFQLKPSRGTGPYRVHSARDDVTRIRLIAATGDEAEPSERDDVRIRSEAAGVAVARFAARDAALVIGGSIADLPLARAARPAASQFQLDPAYGLFGLAVSARSEALASFDARRALAMAIDRERLVQLFGVASWRPAHAILPAQLDSAAPPAALEWVRLDLEARRARARRYLAAADPLPRLRVAMPPGPGARLLFAAIAADWRRIGVTARMVGPRDAADLRLIDEVAPQSSALWYFERLSCARDLPCDRAADVALKAAMAAGSGETRRAALAETDAALASHQPFIPLAFPLRWSLVAPSLTGWRPSAFAIHPLRHLRAE